MNKIIEKLERLGIEEKPARVYLAALELGGGLASEIAQKAGVERTHTYHLLEQLIREGLVYRSERGNLLIFMAQSPKKIGQMIESRLEHAKSLIPELLMLEGANTTKPKIKLYEGIEGIKQLFEETFELPRDSETLAYSSAESIHEYLQDYVPQYLKRRARKGISQRAIAEDSEEAREHQKMDREELRQTRLVNKERFPFKNEINIFGNKIMIASYRDLMGVIIESREIADTQRAIFELAWLGAATVCDTKKLKNQETKEQSVEKIQKTTQKVIFERDGKILMMKDTKGNWELPGGTIDFSEEPEAALERELKEEMDLNPNQYQIGEMIGKFNIMHHFPDKHYHFLVLVYKGELKVENFKISDEHIERGWFAISEILKLQMVEGYKEFFERNRLKNFKPYPLTSTS
jgi:8-oxo-dGTP diphosphatase